MSRTAFLISAKEVDLDELFQKCTLVGTTLEDLGSGNPRIRYTEQDNHLWIYHDQTILEYAEKEEIAAYTAHLKAMPTSSFTIEMSRSEGIESHLFKYANEVANLYPIIIQWDNDKIVTPQNF